LKNKWLKGAVFTLSLLCGAAFSMYASANAQAKREMNALSGIYQKALYEAGEMLSSMQITLKKLSITNSGAMEIEHLSDISRQAQSIQDNLSSLPGGGEVTSETVRFVNQTGDFSETLLKKLASGGAMTSSDRENINSMLESATALTLDVNTLLTEYLEGRKVFSGNASYADSEEIFTKPAREYPHLVYDGAFSEHSEKKKYTALAGEMVTEAQARNNLSDFFDGEAENISFIGQTETDLPVYEYSLIHDGGKSYAAVSEKGGHVLYVLPEYRRHEEKIDAETLMGEAVRFLFRKGFGEFTTAYFRKYDGVLTVNLAPLQDEVILYPDLIKLEMSMETGKIIGIECTDYFANHTARDIPEPGYGMADILARIGESVYADSVRRAIIPYNAGERQVWESHVISGRDEYLIYSDADTGEEILIYQLVHMADGTIVQ